MSHWYNAQAESCHEIPGKSGKPRATTIRDARANGWFPSVTTVLDILSKPQLDTWKMRQVALAARRLVGNANLQLPVADKEYADFVINEAFEQVDDAADLGTRIHKSIEDFFQGRPVMPDMRKYVDSTAKELERHGIELTGHELRIVSTKYGFGGTTDASIKWNGRLGILDFKSRKSDPKYPMEAYDGQAAQIAAYHTAHYGVIPTAALPIIGANVFISTTEPGRVEIVPHDAAKLAEAWRMFESLLEVWRILKAYDPRPKVATAAA